MKPDEVEVERTDTYLGFRQDFGLSQSQPRLPQVSLIMGHLPCLACILRLLTSTPDLFHTAYVHDNTHDGGTLLLLRLHRNDP